MLNNISDLGLDISINNTLYGNSDFANDINCTLVAAVHICIINTNRSVYCVSTPNSSDDNDSASITISLAVLCHFSEIIMNEIMLCFCNILSSE